jgi:hypothetical protein
VRSYIRKKAYLITSIIVFACFAGAPAICSAEESGSHFAKRLQNGDPLQSEKPNADSKCYVCHPGMKTEEISTIHVAVGISCDVCHGSSTEHMHDEMLMTEPDILYGRSEVRKMCSNPSCHKPGEGREVYGWQDHKDPAAVEAFFEKWTGRIRPNGRAVNHNSVCTDCHGTHNINKTVDKKSGDQQQTEWVAAFDGSDLSGWQTSDAANWKVQSGRIIGTADTNENGSTGSPSRAPSREGSILWTKETYENYQLAVTFRATWPVHAGILLRGDETKTGTRIEIFDSPPAFTGSVFVPDKGLVLTNIRKDLVDRESWNTISARVEGDKVQVWLNGEEIGSVRGITQAKGNIGLYIEGPHFAKILQNGKPEKLPSPTSGEFSVHEVQIQKLIESKEK